MVNTQDKTKNLDLKLEILTNLIKYTFDQQSIAQNAGLFNFASMLNDNIVSYNNLRNELIMEKSDTQEFKTE